MALLLTALEEDLSTTAYLLSPFCSFPALHTASYNFDESRVDFTDLSDYLFIQCLLFEYLQNPHQQARC